MELSDGLSIISVMIGILGLLYGYVKDRENKKLNAQLVEKSERLKANEMYDRIRNKREVFEEYLADMLTIDEAANASTRKSSYMKVCQKYSALYNEIEDFCTKLSDEAIKSDKYVIETVLPILSELAEQQIAFYESLKDYANKHSLDALRKPDYKAFDKYDQFLIKYNGGENGHLWRKIKNLRRDAGFE
jgi:hypothetical protein